MPETLYQTDISASCGTIGSGATASANTNCTISLGAAAGTRSASIGGISAGDGIKAGLGCQSGPSYPNSATWISGTYTLRLNVTTGNVSCNWRLSEVICLSGGACSVSSLANQTLSSVAMSAGIYTMTIIDPSGTSTVASSQLYFNYGVNVAGATMPQTFVITLNQGIDVPFSTSVLAALAFGLCTMRCGT